MTRREQHPSYASKGNYRNAGTTEEAHDEISLVDLWLVLVRHKVVIASVLLTSLALGVIYALTMPPMYAYLTPIEIGSRVANNRLALIENPETVQAKIRDGYVPEVQQEYLKTHANDQKEYKIEANIPKGSNLVVLKSTGTKDQSEIYVGLHEAVVQLLQRDHQRALDVNRKGLEIGLDRHRRELLALQDETRVVNARLERLDDERKLLAKEIADLRELVATGSRNRGKAVRETTDEAKAMTLLMISDELHRNRARLTNLEKRTTVDIPNERDQLIKKLADIERQRKEASNQIESLQLELSNIQETRNVTPPMRSIGRVGLGRTTVVIFSGLVGLLLGFLAALVAEFITRVKLTARS